MPRNDNCRTVSQAAAKGALPQGRATGARSMWEPRPRGDALLDISLETKALPQY